MSADAHTHIFDEANPLAERRLWWVVTLTVVMMTVEITAGWLFNSMALLADGWHMSSHAIALGLSAAAYALARRYASDGRFAFGTWKIEVLGGYTSALFLVAVAVYMVYESVTRLIHPASIGFDQAIAVATVGFAVNVVSAALLAGTQGHHNHSHDHGSDHDHSHTHHHDLNMRSAFVHVAADAATSVLAIGALIGGKYFSVGWLDPVVGIVGAALVAAWAAGLLRDTSRVLLDAEIDAPIVAKIRECVQRGAADAQIQDLHVWRVGKGKYACVLEVATAQSASADDFRAVLSEHPELAHVTIEIDRRSTGS